LMDRDRIEYSSGDLRPDQNPEEIRRLDMAPEKVIEQIETCGAWMVIKNVECMPEYRALLEDILGSGAREAGFDALQAAGMTDIQGFIFIASANSVTPFHADNEDNLFVHLRGRKFFHVIENEDRTIVSDADLESYPGKHRNLKYREEFEKRAIVYDLAPGDGIFVPYNWPHWVETGDDYAISMQVTWRSPRVARLNKLQFANAILRSIHLPQAAPGRYPLWDGFKIAAYTLARGAAEPLRRSRKLRSLIHRAFFSRHKDYYYGNEA
ncbi:MAG: cupin-like domain-containing protein, partial [Fimbriimonadaceae bacterium]|nr:cupin-like domain-containing protein [Alphaproteobacteria bacterium]